MKTACVSTVLILGICAACSEQEPNSQGEGPMERAGKAVDRTADTAARETRNGILHSKVRLALLEALGTDALRLEIDVDEGNVSLSGNVREPNSRDQARELALKVDGVNDVQADIHLVAAGSDDVEPSKDMDEKISDRMLEAKVRLKLLGAIGAPALKIGIAADDGAITLSGSVADPKLRAQISKTAKDTEGVSRVIDAIDTNS
jgi:osmotically-inducible protein OsmY